MAVIKLHNTLSGEVEDFKPLVAQHVGIYQCGPTVYDTAHIGNFRTFILYDLVRRMFEYNAYGVMQVMNITDVDDKMIRRSSAEHISLQALAHKYEELFISDMTAFNILPPHKLLRATDYIAEMIDMIAVLLERDIAYQSTDGIYFSIGKSKDYGALAHLPKSAIVNARDTSDEYDKENPRDFALWKFQTSEDGEVGWDAPFGKGRPGWHIECSAMSLKALGPSFDIHVGGVDLIFPHHTNEIAQSEAATGKHYVNYWVHGGFMNVDDAKMSKSAHNFIRLEDLTVNLISPLGFRYWLLGAHYRTQVNFTKDAVLAAQNALIKLMSHIMEWPLGGNVRKDYVGRFTDAISNDLGMPQALALTWELVHDTAIEPADKRATILDFDRVFGLGLAGLVPAAETPVPPEVQALVDAREDARIAKDFAKSDALRAEIEERGFTVKDTSTGPVVKDL